jgi:CheY-like chemotaxis protein
VRRVLVVDDDKDIRDTIVELLSDEGYEVVSARDGVEALKRLRERPTDLVILDLMMPRMDGWQFRREQVADPHLAHIPVVVVSAYGHRDDIEAEAFVPKPCDLQALLDAVERHASPGG